MASPRAEQLLLAAHWPGCDSAWTVALLAIVLDMGAGSSTDGLPGGRAGWSTSSSSREGAMSSAPQLLDVGAGRRCSPATLPDFHAGRAPGNEGRRYAADPSTVDEIIAVMRHAGHARYGNRLNGLIVVLWRAGLPINEALSLNETEPPCARCRVVARGHPVAADPTPAGAARTCPRPAPTCKESPQRRSSAPSTRGARRPRRPCPGDTTGSA